jgi:hypothetical protein
MCTLIDLSARLHDIGKLRVPDSILLKPGRFTADERAIMTKHCEQGWELIGEGGLKQLFVAQEIALNHHERWDGTGYPNRRQGNMIPLAARVAALADVFDALTHRRCYKDAWPVDDALREIASLRGKHFDPELTDLFLEMVPQLQAQHPNLDAYLGAEARKNDFIADRARGARTQARHGHLRFAALTGGAEALPPVRRMRSSGPGHERLNRLTQQVHHRALYQRGRPARTGGDGHLAAQVRFDDAAHHEDLGPVKGAHSAH